MKYNMEEKGSTSEGNTSMEELKVEEDESKDVLMEDDIMGTQRLFFSESEDNDNYDNTAGDGKNSPQKNISHKKSKRLFDSDDEDINENTQNAVFAYEENNKISKIVDSESDSDKTDSEKESNLLLMLSNDLNCVTEAQDVNVAGCKQLKHHTKNSKLDKRMKRKTKKGPKNSLTQNSSQSHIESLGKREETKGKTGNSKSRKAKKGNKETKKVLPLVDIDTSDTENNSSKKEGTNLEENTENSEKLKIVRASAKKAMNEMQAIQSEQQRLHREAYISIPYHKPRKHTLNEFLKRRTVIQPQVASPVAATIQTRSLKMSPEELEEYAKLMEERAKEATEFFKSESENEDNDNKDILDKPVETTEQSDANISNQTLHLPNENAVQDESRHSDGLQLIDKELAPHLAKEELPQVESEQEIPTVSKVLITEVIELPKLDMNSVRISPVKIPTPRSSLNIKQLLAEKNLSESPSLSGDPNKLIDLETGNIIEKQPTGMENLMKRLMSSVKVKQSKNSEICNILSVENGIIEMSKINITGTDTEDVQKDTKPGAAYFELKKNLKEIIKKKRLEGINKKQEDEVVYNKCLAEDNDEDLETKEMCDENYEADNSDIMDHEEENASPDVKHPAHNNAEYNIGEEDSENKEDNDNQTDDEEKEEEKECRENVDKSLRKIRILKAYNDTDEEEDENDDRDFLKTQPPTTATLLESQVSKKTSLYDEEVELIGLCSGNFEKSQRIAGAALMSQIPHTQNHGKPLDDEVLMELCSGDFDQPLERMQQTASKITSSDLETKCKKVLSSDEENDEEELSKNEKTAKKIKKLTKKLRQGKAKLGFSDDEEENESEYEENENLEIASEEQETFVDYDSEENEILVQLTKKDTVKRAENFFEKEAELSESEWGSADEDENNLDKYDIELGDEDEFDREKLQTELGQIHARKMLDEDIREVRKIQEMLFEDEEIDGVGRQRAFKWKNAENGFNLDDIRTINENDDGENGESGDELNEHQWRKIRYEREQFFKEHGIEPVSQNFSTALSSNIIKLNSMVANDVTTKRLQIIKSKNVEFSNSGSKRSSAFLISKGISGVHKTSARGSFLMRDKETLDKLAGLTKITSSSTTTSYMDNAASNVSIKGIKPTNFVFATLTEEEHENLKRKADDLLNSSSEYGTNFMKKPRVQPRRDKCFIDQLL